MMKRLLCLAAGLLLLVPSLLGITALHRAAPAPERLGYLPSFEVTFFSSLEFRYLLSELLFYDLAFYYGSVLDRPGEKPDYLMMARYVDTATRLNAFNIDAYYLGQAVLTWDAGMVRDMNVILERGVKRRNWDFYLPFFLGFNHAYFLNDRDSAAKYLEISSKLNPQLVFLPNLVGRLYYEANKTEQAIQYLEIVRSGTHNDAVKMSIDLRISALQRIQLLEQAVKRFRQKTGRAPSDLRELVDAGLLREIPADPYGGSFFYDRKDGRIKTTSKMTPQEQQK